MSLHVAPNLKFKPPLERDIQRGIITLFRHAGIHVGSTSQYRESRVEEGIPDLMCHALPIAEFWWFEVKGYERTWTGRAGSVRFNPYDRATWKCLALRPKQEEFRARSLKCGVRYYFGGVVEAEDVLIHYGFGRRAPSGVFEYVIRRPLRRPAMSRSDWPHAYDCPECGDPVAVPDQHPGSDPEAVCACGARLVLDVDYDEPSPGAMVDCSHWRAVKP